MRIDAFATQLRKLTDDYYHQLITLEEYRQQRKVILDEVDSEINHVRQNASATDFAT